MAGNPAAGSAATGSAATGTAATGSAAAGMGRGVLRPGVAATRLTLARHEPAADLAPFVDFFWVVRWDLRGQPPHDQSVLPHPNVNLVFESALAAVYGVDRHVFTRRLAGRDKALGVRFRPGGFRPFLLGAGEPGAVAGLTDRAVDAAVFFGQAAEATRVAIMAAEGDAEMIEHAERLLLAADPERDPVAEQVAAIVDGVVDDPALRQVRQLAAVSGIGVRRLERLFADYVGVSPKWVMRRARLHDAAHRADAGGEVDWGGLAAELGYADQAHLSRDFAATIGVPPTRYIAANAT